MKAGWKTARIGDVCALINGDRGENYPGRAAFVEEGVPFVNAGHLTDHGLDDESMNFIPRERFDRLGNGKIQRGDILFCLRGSLGKYAKNVSYDEGAIASSLVIVRPNTKVDPDFILAYFGSSLCADMISEYANGTAQPNLAAKSLSQFLLPLPPLEEQRRIVAVLDEAFAGIATATENARKNLTNARALFDGFLESTIEAAQTTCKTVSLTELTTDISDGDHMPPPKAEAGVPFITIGNIDKQTRAIDFDDTFMVSIDYFAALKPNRRPRRGDVLYTVTGSFGIPVLVDQDRDFCFQRHIGLVRPKPTTDSKWLSYLLRSPQVLAQAEAGATGTAQKTVSLKVLRNFSVPSMALADQIEAVGRLDTLSAETDRLANVYQHKLSDLAELKQSLLHKAFAGELTR